jgi:phenylpyruvate tautomerase PptA (4-oxalocrotonate tautomerase family)
VSLVKVNLLKGRSAKEKESIAASIQTALVNTLKVPEADRYQLFNEYDGESFRHTGRYLGMDVFILITEIGRANVSFGKGLAQRAPTSTIVASDMSGYQE